MCHVHFLIIVKSEGFLQTHSSLAFCQRPNHLHAEQLLINGNILRLQKKSLQMSRRSQELTSKKYVSVQKSSPMHKRNSTKINVWLYSDSVKEQTSLSDQLSKINSQIEEKIKTLGFDFKRRRHAHVQYSFQSLLRWSENIGLHKCLYCRALHYVHTSELFFCLTYQTSGLYHYQRWKRGRNSRRTS